MTKEKHTFIQSLFQLLQADTYVLLKWFGDDLATLPEGSDLDILIRPELIQKIESFFNSHSSILKVNSSKRTGVRHYYIFFKNNDFLQIDLLLKFVRKQLTYLSTEKIFDKNIIFNGIKTCDTATIFEHALLFNYLNYSGLPTKYYKRYSKLSLTIQHQLLKRINDKYNTNFKSIKDTVEFTPHNRVQIIKYLNGQRENSIINKVINLGSYIKAVWCMLKEENSQTITFSGVDGAGKSTIINEIRTLLGNKYRKKVVVLRHRPSLLPIISAWKYGKKGAEQRSVARLPRQGTNKSKIASYLRFSYYYSDYLLGQIYVWWKYLLRGYTVLYDRYYFDFILDGKRSNINLSEKFPKSLYPFIAKPKLNFFLYADAATILERKKELSPTVIKILTKKYKTLFKEFSGKYNGLYLPIENINKQETLHTILTHYLKNA